MYGTTSKPPDCFRNYFTGKAGNSACCNEQLLSGNEMKLFAVIIYETTYEFNVQCFNKIQMTVCSFAGFSSLHRSCQSVHPASIVCGKIIKTIGYG